ncbi:glycosyltransferase, partial [bacterium]|nr:glycosyltransferase [candidate division CSSED10-310 bacterium]
QAKVHRYQDNAYLEHFKQHELTALRIGDVFSSVSRAQGFATIGELGLLNRLNVETTGYTFCHTIPCAMEPHLYRRSGRRAFRGCPVPEDAFVVLWSGGYNTWTDIDTLAAGLEYAMERNRAIWFVSTGGQIDGHDERTYPAFVDRVRKSRFRDRFVLRGWIPKDDVPDYYFEANIGINIDRFMYEGMFGSKNRVLDWMRADLPALIGELCEISRELPAQNLAYSFPLHDADTLGSTILRLAEDPDAVAATGLRARQYGLEHLTFHATVQPFLDWVQQPRPAPDRAVQAQQSRATSSLQPEPARYVQNLLTQLQNKDAHIEQLETYIRHLETELKRPPDHSGHTPSIQRPPLTPIPLPLPNHPSISIVIVTWNGLADLDACLRSAVNHDYADKEIIVVDNGSIDGTADFIKTRYPEIRLIENNENQGFTRGVNQGIDAAKGNVIFLLNQDAVMMPGLLGALVDGMRDPHIAIAGCKIWNPDGITLQHAGGILHDNGLTDHYGAGETDTGQFDEDRDVVYVTGAAFAFKKQLVDEIGRFDPRYSPAYYEELDFCLRAARAGYRVRYVHQAAALHHESTSTGKFSRRFYQLYHRNRLKFILKHYSARYLLGTFRRFEWRWLRDNAPREQLIPLLTAYATLAHRFLWVFIRSAKGRFLS